MQAQHESETPSEGTHRVHVHLQVPRLHVFDPSGEKCNECEMEMKMKVYVKVFVSCMSGVEGHGGHHFLQT